MRHYKTERESVCMCMCVCACPCMCVRVCVLGKGKGVSKGKRSWPLPPLALFNISKQRAITTIVATITTTTAVPRTTTTGSYWRHLRVHLRRDPVHKLVLNHQPHILLLVFLRDCDGRAVRFQFRLLHQPKLVTVNLNAKTASRTQTEAVEALMSGQGQGRAGIMEIRQSNQACARQKKGLLHACKDDH